jgi:hypothetical protein
MAGRSIPARMAIMAITTSNSMRENAFNRADGLTSSLDMELMSTDSLALIKDKPGSKEGSLLA